MARLDFDASSIAVDERTFEPIPAGNYLCQVIASDLVHTKKGDGQYLQLTLQVLDDPYANRQVWDRLNIINPNEKAREIAQRNLASLCRAVGLVHVHDSQELHFKPFIAQLGIEESPGYEPKNKVVRYKPREGMQTAAAPKNTPIVERDASNPNRVNVLYPPAPPARQPDLVLQRPRNGGPKPWQKPPA